MANTPDLADKDYVADQYQTATNLNARISLHRRFSTNRYGWFTWVFDHLQFPPQAQILELGCGPGDLWRKNVDRIPGGWALTLTDVSAGMVAKAQQNLVSTPHPFRFEIVDAQAIPYAGGRFDGVLANHMLYHMSDRARALSEIRRALKPEGIVYASTVGTRHLQEIGELLMKFDAQFASWGDHHTNDFTLDNGAAQLAHWFSDVVVDRYDDALIVTEPEPLVDYVLSGGLTMTADQREEFRHFVREEFRRREGTFYVTKESGMFEARGSITS